MKYYGTNMINSVEIWCFLTTAFTVISGAEILGIFPTASYSHQQPLMALSKALAAKGHNLTVITTDPIEEPMGNLRQVNLSSLYKDWEAMQKTGVLSLQERGNPWLFMRDICGYLRFANEKVLMNHQFQQFLRELNGSTYDLILYESLGYSALLGIREMVGDPPVVGIITLHPHINANEPMGNPYEPTYAPYVFLGHDDKMTMWERLKNTAANLYSYYIFSNCILPMNQEYINKYFSSVKRTAKELEYGKSLLIVTSDLATGYPKPVQPNTIYVGPIHLQEKPPPLPLDVQEWMDSATNGVIYFSLGCNMQSLSVPDHIRNAFVKAFNKFPKLRVLWKWEADTKIPDQPSNVLTKKWFPQRSVLAHPNLKVFISQGGSQSFQEAIENSVPILSIPMFADQDYNAKKLLRTGAGNRLEFSEITYEEVYEKLNALLTNSSYRTNMQKLLSLTKDKPMSGIDTAIWWIEYVIRHDGASHLRPAVLDLYHYQYYMLDLLLVIFIIPSIILLILWYSAKRLYYRVNTVVNIIRHKTTYGLRFLIKIDKIKQN